VELYPRFCAPTRAARRPRGPSSHPRVFGLEALNPFDP
jgi:hypothetical protein